MSTIDKIKKQAKKAGIRNNQAETKKGGSGDYPTPAAGEARMRLLEYIELGIQPQGKWKGTEKPPAATAIISFELLGKKHQREVEVDGKKVMRGTYFRLKQLALSMHEKAGFKKLFNVMTKTFENPAEITHMAQMIGEPFFGDITHRESEKDGTKVTYANLNDESGNYRIRPPVVEKRDEDGEVISTEKVKFPELSLKPRIFLFDEPTKEDFEALDDNLKAKIRSAKNFKGSAVEQLLGGLDDVPELNEEEEYASIDEEEEDVPVKPKAKKSKPVHVEEDEIEEEEEEPASKKVKPKAKKASLNLDALMSTDDEE